MLIGLKSEIREDFGIGRILDNFHCAGIVDVVRQWLKIGVINGSRCGNNSFINLALTPSIPMASDLIENIDL